MSEEQKLDDGVDLSLLKSILVTNPENTNLVSSLNKLISDQRQSKIIQQLINAYEVLTSIR